MPSARPCARGGPCGGRWWQQGSIALTAHAMRPLACGGIHTPTPSQTAPAATCERGSRQAPWPPCRAQGATPPAASPTPSSAADGQAGMGHQPLALRSSSTSRGSGRGSRQCGGQGGPAEMPACNRGRMFASPPHLVLNLHAEQHRGLHVLEGHVEGVALSVDLVAGEGSGCTRRGPSRSQPGQTCAAAVGTRAAAAPAPAHPWYRPISSRISESCISCTLS